jgi:hypothetical protein
MPLYLHDRWIYFSLILKAFTICNLSFMAPLDSQRTMEQVYEISFLTGWVFVHTLYYRCPSLQILKTEGVIPKGLEIDRSMFKHPHLLPEQCCTWSLLHCIQYSGNYYGAISPYRIEMGSSKMPTFFFRHTLKPGEQIGTPMDTRHSH